MACREEEECFYGSKEGRRAKYLTFCRIFDSISLTVMD
jgi:hypothetical protein